MDETRQFDVPLTRMTLTQQINETKAELERLKDEFMQLGLEVPS